MGRRSGWGWGTAGIGEWGQLTRSHALGLEAGVSANKNWGWEAGQGMALQELLELGKQRAKGIRAVL